MRNGTRLTLLVVAFFVGGYIIYPLLAVLGQSLTHSGSLSFGHYQSFFEAEWRRGTGGAIWGSVWISAATVFLAALIGIPLALLFSGPDYPGRRIMGALMVLPLALPPMVGVLAFQRLFVIQPVLERLFGFPALDGIPMVLLVHVYSFFVYFYIFTRTGLDSLDASLAEAAQGLGASRMRTFFTVTLPALRSHLAAAALVTFMVSMASFTAPFIFAPGRLRVLTVQIKFASEASKANEAMVGLAAVQSVLLALVCLIFMFAVRAVEGRGAAMPGKGAARRREPAAHSGTRMLLAGVSAFGVFVVGVPHLTILYISMIKTPGIAESFTLEHYQRIFGEAGAFRPVANSLRLALASALCNLGLGLAAAYLIGWRRFKGQGLLDVGVMLPFALPGTVIAYCLIAAFNEPGWLTGNQALVGTSGILMFAYVIRHLPLAVRPAVAAFRTLDPSLEEAAQGLGASGSQTMLKVLLPCVLPGLLAGGLLGFVTALGEFVSSIMLYNPHNEPISVSIWKKMDQYRVGQAAAYGVLLMLMVGGTLIVYGLLTRRLSRTSVSV